MKQALRGAWRLLIIFACLALPLVVLAQMSPNMQRGLNWLGQQMRSTGPSVFEAWLGETYWATCLGI